MMPVGAWDDEASMRLSEGLNAAAEDPASVNRRK